MDYQIGDYAIIDNFIFKNIKVKIIGKAKHWYGEDFIYCCLFPENFKHEYLHFGFVGYHTIWNDSVKNNKKSDYANRCYNVFGSSLKKLKSKQLELFE